jgi:hypothetical protein
MDVRERDLLPTGESYHPKISGHANGYYPVIHAVTG